MVRYIFRLYLKDGLGIRRIARRLNEEELRPIIVSNIGTKTIRP